MRISDWSSDVCSSDLRPVFVLHHGNPRWALISIPLLSNLADEADHDAGDARLAALHDITLDHMRNMMIVLDSDLVITGINAAARRSQERRVGTECVSTCRSAWSPVY